MKDSEYANIGKIFRLLKGVNIHPAYLLVPISLSILAAAFEGASLGLLVPMLTGFIEKSYAFIFEVPVLGDIVRWLPLEVQQNDRLLFLTVVSCFIAAVLLKNVLRYFANISIGFVAERALHHLRKVLFGRYLSFGKQYFDTSNIGHHSTVLIEFTRAAFRPLIHVNKFMNALFSLMVYAVVMLIISWQLTLVALPLFVLLHFAVRTMISRIRMYSRKIAEKGSELGKQSIAILSTVALVKAYSAEEEEKQAYSTISDEKGHLDFTVRALQELILPLQEIITMVTAVILFLTVLYFIGRDTIGGASSFIVYFYVVLNASNKFGTLTSFRGTLAGASGSIDEVLVVMSDDDKYFVKSGKDQFTGLQKAIDFSGLNFTYDDERQVLRDVSFSVKKGSMTAIVGPTGSGKSTLIHLLMRFYDCDPDAILLDGTDIRNFSTDSLMNHIALVSQDTLLLNASLRDNIAYGLENVPDEKVQAALERARLSTFVSALPNGLDTLIGDRGVQLSGGEKQRVSIARALLKEAEILILDEATSALDSATEVLIQEAIDEAVKDCTSIVIAHRLSTIRHADHIVAMKDGECVEQGAYDELSSKKGVFAELLAHQNF